MPAKANSERLGAARELTEHAAERALEAERMAQGQLVPAVVYELDDLRFDSDGVALDPGSASRLDQLAERLLAEGVGCHFEICAQANRAGADRGPLALERAEAIRRRLHQQHGLPLWRVHTMVGSCEATGTDEAALTSDRAAVAVFRDAPELPLRPKPKS
jgi:outer membrane protein OmpA-like peptidoglycan-associated protein